MCAALPREGAIDDRLDRITKAGRRHIAEHIDAYITDARNPGRAPRRMQQVAKHLKRFIAGTGFERLADLDADRLSAYMSTMRAEGKASATIGHARESIVAFANWCCRTGKLETNPVGFVPRLDVSRHRLRVRRALSDDEMASLIAVAREHGREAWYLAAALAGLRKGDLQRLTWTDVDFDADTITIRGGKAKRIDVLPMHPQLRDALLRRREQFPAIVAAMVFPQTVTDRTYKNDFLYAGIASRVLVLTENGEPVLVCKGNTKRPNTRIVAEDEDGRVIDLHALRTTLGTQLARAGVAPEVAQRLMRHADFRTTNKHYTVLGLADSARAIEAIPSVQSSDDTERATGTAAAN
ncbi:MAG: site-specific integrase, partial [Pseudomonadota bacterium]